VSKNGVTLKPGLGSFKVIENDISYTTYYWSAIVSIALCCTIFEISSYLTFNNRDLEIWVRGHSRSLKLVPFERLGAVSYSPFILTMTVSLTVYEVSKKNSVTLKTRLGVVQGH